MNLTCELIGVDSSTLMVYSFRSKIGTLSLTSWTSTKIVRFVDNGDSPPSVAVTVSRWRWSVSKSKCCDNVRYPVLASMLKRLLFSDEFEPLFDNRYVIVPLLPESRSVADTTYNAIPNSRFSGTEILTVLDSNVGALSLMSSTSIFTCENEQSGGRKLKIMSWE